MSQNSQGRWPPSFKLDQERILEHLTGDRFYSDPSAALREAVLNAIDATHRRCREDGSLAPEITVTFDRENRTLTVDDNGIGMGHDDVTELFATVGASAANADAVKDSVGEFGIGVVSYFMAGDSFTLQTYGGDGDPIGLRFTREMLAGAGAEEIPATRLGRGTSVNIHLRDGETFEQLLESYPHWCRDVEGLSAHLEPSSETLDQGGASHPMNVIDVERPKWVERAHLGPVDDPPGWNAMDGISTVAVLYRGVFVQEFQVRGIWGIRGSIDVDPKHFKPRLDREGFVKGEFQGEVTSFLREVHPRVLLAMTDRLRFAIAAGELESWNQNKWGNLWLSVPRTHAYEAAVHAWDDVFRTVPAFDLGVGDAWRPVSLEDLKEMSGDIFVAPLKSDKTTDIVQAAVRFLRHSGCNVIRGIKKDPSWLRFASASYTTTADLIAQVFSDELPPLRLVQNDAEEILKGVARVAPLYTGPPSIDLIRIGPEGPPALRLADRLVINVDHPGGIAMVEGALSRNSGAEALIGISAREAYEQMSQVAAVVRDVEGGPEILSPVRRRFIRSRLA